MHSSTSEADFGPGDDLWILLYGAGEFEPSEPEARFEAVDAVEEAESDLARFPLLGVEKSILEF